MIEVIPDPLDGERIDRVVSMLAGLSRSAAATAVTDGLVSLDGAVVAKASQRVATGQELSVQDSVFEPEAELAADASVELNLLHVDDDVLVVDKAVGQVVHPGAGHTSGTIAQGVLARFPEVRGVGDPDRPGIVHRLDKGTSGVFMIARTERAYDSLTEQLRERSVSRRYLTLAWGHPKTQRGVIEAPIGRAVRDPTRMVVREDGKPARTAYAVAASWASPKISLFSCELDTGRTHQIRVHMSHSNHPLFSDSVYGGDQIVNSTVFSKYKQFVNNCFEIVPRQSLHAKSLGFIHPSTNEFVKFESELPDDFQNVLEKWRHYVLHKTTKE